MTSDDAFRLSPWRMLSGSPLRFLFSSYPWRAVAYTIISLALGWTVFMAYVVIVLLPFAPAWSILLGRIERQRVRMLRMAAIADPHPAVTGSFGARARARLAEPVTWREVVYSLALAAFAPLATLGLLIACVLTGGFAAAPLVVAAGGQMSIGPWQLETPQEAWRVVPVALPLFILTLYLFGAAAAIMASIAAGLLGPREEELAAQVADLRSSRGTLVGSFEAERRRIERDLHDGPQQHLVGAVMHLGEIAQDSDDPATRAHIETAQARVERALAELRDTVRGVNPRVLDDHGVEAACAELGGPVLVRVIRGPGWTPGRRLPAETERALFYTASEAVTNAAKHGGASTVTIEFAEAAGVVSMTVTDDGCGGAVPAAGRGLAGLVERAATIGASLTVVSPVGGPTVLRWSGSVRG
ncbi:histidine kinase [Gordonia sihwensis]|uniref:sensor histidine kinase n=1 Tax=Gordonia sihwensis TaxID=173559 RepID=UPI003D964770